MSEYQRKKSDGAESVACRSAGPPVAGPVSCQRRCADLIAREPVQRQNRTGMPDNVKAGMESAFSTDFSGVTVHASSARAPEVGALACTQGSDIHFAPGQFRPDTSAGRELLGHELAHVVQQGEGRVRPTCEVAGMPVNDNGHLEAEADRLGQRAARFLQGSMKE